MLKTVSSLQSKEKFKFIGQSTAKEIIKGVRDLTARNKLKSVATELGTKRISLVNLVKRVNKNQGALMADKLIAAAQKHLNNDIDPVVQKRFMRANMQRDESAVRTDYRRANISVLGKVGGGVHGEAGRLGIGNNQSRSRTSALNSASNKPLDGPAQKALGGVRPIGL